MSYKKKQLRLVGNGNQKIADLYKRISTHNGDIEVLVAQVAFMAGQISRIQKQLKRSQKDEA